MSLYSHMLPITFTHILDFIGTFAFAISGIRMASSKNFDWFGAYVVGFVTAIGGGTLRDILLNVSPFWMQNPSYVFITAFALLFVILFRKQIVKLEYTIFTFDTIGLALFTVVGIERTLASGFHFWIAIIMGIMTGAVGGIIRDILINEVPLIFRKDIYAMACVAGGVVYFICYKFNCNIILTEVLSAVAVIATRVIAVKFHITLPVLHSEDE
jgi:uncharacterized membrane protein YeiH